MPRGQSSTPETWTPARHVGALQEGRKPVHRFKDKIDEHNGRINDVISRLDRTHVHEGHSLEAELTEEAKVVTPSNENLGRVIRNWLKRVFGG